MIKDHKGKTPNYVIVDDKLVHQPTGRYVQIYSLGPSHLRTAISRLRKLIYADLYGAGEIKLSLLAGTYPIK